MAKQQASIQRKGRIYHFTVNEKEYAAFVWEVGKQFRGRVEGQTHVPEQTATTALAVRQRLHNWIATNTTP